MQRMEIKNSKGEVIKLNAREELIANFNQNIVNALGYQIDITTLTTIIKKVSEQKFYEIPVADYLPVVVGEGAWSSDLTKYLSFALADDFESGLINTGSNNGRLAGADAGIDSVTVKVKDWAKENTWTLFDLQKAAKSGNWDLVEAKEKARKKNWDLGIQKVAFLGIPSDSRVKGLLTQADVNSNTSVITNPISGLSAANLNTIVASLYEAYRSNCNRTAKPTLFGVPESDFNGLASQVDASFPIKTKLELLEEALQKITMNKSFKVLPLAYGDPANSQGTLSVRRYVLANHMDEDSLRMDIPVDYTATLANSTNNFSFQNVGYGQLSGAKAYRPAEVLYFDGNS